MTRVGRVSWGVVDQAMVSLGAAVVSVQGAASLPVAEFGALATALAAYYLMTAAVRGAVSDVYVVRFASTPHVPRTQAGDALSAVLFLSLAMSAALAVVAWLVGGAATRVTVALAVAVPVLLLQDLRRAVLVAAAATRRSALASAVTLTGQLVGGAALHVSGHVSAAALLLVWAAAAGIGIASVHLPGLGAPGPTRARAWWRSSRSYWPLLAEALAQSGTNQASLLVVAGLGGAGLVGALRAATLLLAPMVMLHQASGRQLVAEASRVDRAALLRLSVRCQAGFLLMWGAWLVVVGALPGRVLAHLLGDVLPDALLALPGMTAFTAAGMLVLAPAAVLFVSGRLVVSLLTRLALTPFLVGVPLLLVSAGADVRGVATGFGVFGVCAVLVWNVVAWAVLRTTRAAHGPVAALAGNAGGRG